MSRMETYPTTISLGEESAQMWSLNKRLEAYLSRVKALEEENELLRAEIHHLRSTKSDKSVIRKYHDEIMKLRDALDDGHREMVQVEIDRDSIYQEIEFVTELCHQEKQAQENVKKELSESKRLLEEEKRNQIWLKERLIQLEQEMEDILKVHEEDKALMEEEISSYSQRLDNFKVAPTNLKPVNVEDYANKLSQIWQGAVEEYKNEVSALEANLSQSKENLKKVLDENKQSELQLQTLDRDLESLKVRKEMLEKLLADQWLEQQEEEGRLQLEVDTLEKEKQDLKLQIAQVLEDRQQLMHLKMSLSLEVATYRSLLEAESTRIYSPSTDYKVSSSFNDSVLEQTIFRKNRHENTKPLVPRDNRLKANKKQSAETSTTNRYLNVKSTSFTNRASPVTKEFQKVSSVLQSQGLNYTKASSAKAAAALPPVESSLGRHQQNGDVVTKSKVQIISHSYSQDSSKPVTKEPVTKQKDIQPVLNGKVYDTVDLGLKKTDHLSDAKGESLPPAEEETVNAQVESSLKSEGIPVQVISDFGLEQEHFVEAQKKDNDIVVLEKVHKEITDFEVPLANEGFRNTEEHVNKKQEVVRQIVSSQRVYVEREELVEPLEYQNMETPIKVNNEEFRKVLDFSKPNTQELDEPNALSSGAVPEPETEYSLSQELDFDSPVLLSTTHVDNASHDTEDIKQETDEEKEDLQLTEDLELNNTKETSNYIEAEIHLQDEVVMVQKSQVLSSLKEEHNQLFDDGQDFTKDVYDEQKSEMEENNATLKENTCTKETKDIPQDTGIQEYNDNEIDQQPSKPVEDIPDGPLSLENISEVGQWSDDKQEYTQVEQEIQESLELYDAGESMGHLSNEEDFKTESTNKEVEGYEREENILNTEQNICDVTDIEQSRILVKEVYQSTNQVLEDFEEAQVQNQEEKNNFELSDLEQSSLSYDDLQRADTVKTPELISEDFTDDQMDSVQDDVNDGIEQESQVIGGDHAEIEQAFHAMDSKPEELHELLQEESVIPNEEFEEIQKFEKNTEQTAAELQTLQSIPKHKVQSSESDEQQRDGQSSENDLGEEEEEEGLIKTSIVELQSSEIKVGEGDKEDVSEMTYEVCTVEYTKSFKTEVITKSVHEECESYEEDNITEKEGALPEGAEDYSSISEHEIVKESEQEKEHYLTVSTEGEYKENESKQLVQEESDIQTPIAKEDESLLQETEKISEAQSEVSRDMEQENLELDNVHHNSEVTEDQSSDRETSFQHGSEDVVHSDGEKDHEESLKVALITEESIESKVSETEQCLQKDYDIVEEAQANAVQESQILKSVQLGEVEENESEEKNSFHREVEGQESYQEEVEEGYHQEVKEGQEEYLREVEKEKDNYHQKIEEVQEVEDAKENHYQNVEAGKKSYHHEIEEEQKEYHQEAERQEVYQREVEDKVSNDILSENIATEEDNNSHQSQQKDSEEEQYMGFSLNIIPNNLRFTSENDSEVQPDQQEHTSKFSDEGTETHGDGIQVHEELKESEQTKDNIMLETEREQEYIEKEIICNQSTILLAQECGTLLLEKSKSHVVFAENPTESYDIEGPTEKIVTELDEMEAVSDTDNENSKSEDSMDSQDISIYSHKSEDFEISKDYQLEQTLPDTTPLPSFDDEFEDLVHDGIILASEQSVTFTKLQSPSDGGEYKEMLDSNLESQSSQTLPDVSEQSNVIKCDDKGSEQCDESPIDLLDSEHPEHFVDNKLETEDSSGTLRTEEHSTSQSPTDICKTEEVVDSSFEPQSSQIFPEVSDTLNLIKDSDYNEQHDESPIDFVNPAMDKEDYTTTVDSEEVTKSEIPDDGADAKEVLDNSLEPQSSQILPEENEQSNIIKHDEEDLEYNIQDENPINQVDSEHLEHFVDLKLNTEDYSAIQNIGDVIKSESPADGEQVCEQSNFIKDQVYIEQQSETPIDLLDSEHLEYFEDPKLETEDSSATMVTEEPTAESSEDLVEGKTDDQAESDYFAEPKLGTEDISAVVDTEEKTKPQSLSDSGEVEEVIDGSLETHSSHIFSEVSEQQEQQVEPPLDLLQSEQPEHFVDSHLNAEDSSTTLFSEEVTKPQSSTDGDEAEEVLDSSLEPQSSQIFSELSEQSFLIKDSGYKDESSIDLLQSEHAKQVVVLTLDTEVSSATLVTEEVTESQSPADNSEAEEVLDSSLESQSSQILPEESEQLNLIKQDKDTEHTVQQDENPIELLESEQSEYIEEPNLDAEDSPVTLSTEEPAAESCEDAVESKIHDKKTKSEYSLDPKLDKDDSFATGNTDEVTKSQSPTDAGEAEEALEGSSEPQSSEIFLEVNEQSSNMNDYKEQCDESPIDLLESEHSEHFEPSEDSVESNIDGETTESEYSVCPTLDTEDSSTTQNTEEVTKPESSADTEEVTTSQISANTEEVTKPEISANTEEVTKSERSADTEEVTKSEISADTEEITNPESSENTEEVTRSESFADTEEVTKSESSADSEEVTKSKSSADSEEVTKSESSADSEEVTKSESSADSEEITKSESSEDSEEIIKSESSVDTEEVTKSESTADTEEVTKADSFTDGDEAEEVLDSSLESQSSQILPEISEQLHLIKDDADYNEQQDESPKDLVESEHPPNSVDSKLEAEDCSAILITEEVIKSQNPVDGSEAEEVLDSSLESQSSQILSEVCEQTDLIKNSDYNEQYNEIEESTVQPCENPVESKTDDEKTESENSVDHKLDTDNSSAILDTEEVTKADGDDSDYKDQQVESPINLVNSEHPEHFVDPKLGVEAYSVTLDVEEVSKSQGLADTEEVLDRSLESQSVQIHSEVTEQMKLLKEDNKDSDYSEQQDETPVNFPQPSEQFEDTKLDTKDSSATLGTEEPAAEPFEDPIKSNTDDENISSQQSTPYQEEVAIFSPKVVESEVSKDFELEKSQFKTSLLEDQLKLFSEEKGENVDGNFEEPEERRVILSEETETLVANPTEFAPESEHSETELFPSPSHEDTKVNEDYTIKERSDLITQDFKLEQTRSVDTEDHERDFCKEEDQERKVQSTGGGTNEASTDYLLLKEECKIQDEITLLTNKDDAKGDEKPETLSYALDQEDHKTQYSQEDYIGSDTDSKGPKELEQNDPLLTPEPVLESCLTEQMVLQTSSDDEKGILYERSDSSCDSSKDHDDMSEYTREYSEDGKAVNGINGHTIVQATLDLDGHMFNGHSIEGKREIIISEANILVGLDSDIVSSQPQDRIEDSFTEFTVSEGKSEGLFQCLLETSERKEGRIDEASEIKNIVQTAVKYMDSDTEQSHYTKKLINPYLSERDLDDTSEITSSVLDEDLVNTKQELSETNQGLKINQKQEDSWSSDE